MKKLKIIKTGTYSKGAVERLHFENKRHIESIGGVVLDFGSLGDKIESRTVFYIIEIENVIQLTEEFEKLGYTVSKLNRKEEKLYGN